MLALVAVLAVAALLGSAAVANAAPGDWYGTVEYVQHGSWDDGAGITETIDETADFLTPLEGPTSAAIDWTIAGYGPSPCGPLFGNQVGHYAGPADSIWITEAADASGYIVQGRVFPDGGSQLIGVSGIYQTCFGLTLTTTPYSGVGHVNYRNFFVPLPGEGDDPDRLVGTISLDKPSPIEPGGNGACAISRDGVGHTLVGTQACQVTYNLRRSPTTLEVKKSLSPTTDSGRFDLNIDGGSAEKIAAGDGGSTGAQAVSAGTHTVEEAAATGSSTSLSDYDSSVDCIDRNTLTPVIPHTNGPGPVSVPVNASQNVLCTITNELRNHPPVAQPDSYVVAPGQTLEIPAPGVLGNDTDPEDGRPIGARVVSIDFDATEYTWVGNGAFTYRAGAGTEITLVKVITYVAVDSEGAESEPTTATITIRPKAKLEVKKNLVPSTDSGRFDLKVDGITRKGAAGDGDFTVRAYNPGPHNVRETAATASTVLANYDSGIACQDRTSGANVKQGSGPGPLTIALHAGDDVVCTITNTRHVQVACSDGQDNDGDGKIDFPTDPGCSALTDNNEADQHCAVYTPEYSGRVVLAGFPDMDLFRFDPTVTYCFDGTEGTITHASVIGLVDDGVDTAFLEKFGFAVLYNPSQEQVLVSPHMASLQGEFEFAFNFTTLIDKLGLKSKAEKALVAKLGKKLDKIIIKHGYNDQFANAVADATAKLQKDIGDLFLKQLNKLKKVLPDSVVERLRDFVIGKVDAILTPWREKITVALSSEQFTGMAGDKIGTALFQSLFAAFDEKVTAHFAVWNPVVVVTVDSNGNPVSVDEGTHNPLLTVERIL